MNSKVRSKTQDPKRKRALIHHYLCAYVGLSSEFVRTATDRVCPKCARSLQNNPKDWEVIGHLTL